METIKCECGQPVSGSVCQNCGLVWEETTFAVEENAEASFSPFLPMGGLTLDTRSEEFYMRRRSYEAARWIKLARDFVGFPPKLAEGAMIRFNLFLKSKKAFRGERYKTVAGVCILQEAHSWNFPVLEREIIAALDLNERSFRKKRRKMGHVFKPYSAKVLINKYFNENDLPMDERATSLRWLARSPKMDSRAMTAASIYLGTRKMTFSPDIDSLALYFEITKSEIMKARKKIMRSKI